MNRMVSTPVPMSADDLCAKELIQVPGAIQPHGALVVLAEADRRVLHASTNASALLGVPVRLGEILPPDAGAGLHCSTHPTSQGLMLEFEPVVHDDDAPDTTYAGLRDLIDRLEPLEDLRDVGREVAMHIRAITGFSRVLIYQFDPDWNGTVIAEDGDGTLASYLDLRFPASDIPAQARALYLRNRLRLIPDGTYRPVPIEPRLSPIDGLPLDLSAASLRSVSPVHLRYMHNMGTMASMSVSLIADGRLWGLITCHHASPRLISPGRRAACDFIGQLAVQQMTTRERLASINRRIELKTVETALLVDLAHAESLQAALLANPEPWLALTRATGAAVVQDGQVWSVGITPAAAHIPEIAAWLQTSAHVVFATDSLASAWPAAAAFAEPASGLLAIAFSQVHAGYVLWFRQEVMQTVTWAGEPVKSAELGPRTSFARWGEQVRHTALPWHAEEIAAATDFRRSLIDFVLRQAEERAALTERLEASNKELEAFSYSVSHDLRAPFRHIVGYAELLRERETGLDATSARFLDTIRDAALSAGRLVDDLLAFSQLNRVALAFGRVDMDKLATEARTACMVGISGRRIEWKIGALPEAWGDAAMLRQAMLNLLQNAVKYTGRREVAEIIIEGQQNDTETVYIVRDNGIGFDMRYVGKLFGVFQRLHRMEDFEGTGIGLALTKRVISRHGGWIKADAVIDKGATFTFALPRREKLLA